MARPCLLPTTSPPEPKLSFRQNRAIDRTKVSGCSLTQLHSNNRDPETTSVAAIVSSDRLRKEVER